MTIASPLMVVQYAVGVHESVLYRIEGFVRKLIFGLRGEYIKRPSCKTEALAIQTAFYEKYELPRCLGLIDGTKIKITAPKKSQGKYKIFRMRNMLSYNQKFQLNVKGLSWTIGVTSRCQ